MGVEIDQSQLLALAGDDKSLLLPIVNDFREDGLRLIGQIEHAQGEGDKEQLKRDIHQLKGASGSLGMKSLYALCVDIERMAEDGVSEGCVSELYQQLDGSIQLALSCLDG